MQLTSQVAAEKFYFRFILLSFEIIIENKHRIFNSSVRRANFCDSEINKRRRSENPLLTLKCKDKRENDSLQFYEGCKQVFLSLNPKTSVVKT